MAIYRSIHTTFWTDTKVVDDFTPEDKYFMLYCLTNNYTNLCGCYEISVKQMTRDLGYNEETVLNLLKRFAEIHKVIFYDKETKELFIKNWSKYNWTNSSKLDKPLLEEIKNIKNPDFKMILRDEYNNRDTVSIPYLYGMDTTDTDTVSNTISDIVYIDDIYNNNIEQEKPKRKSEKDHFEEIIDDYTNNPEFKDAINEFIKMRKSIKKPLTENALKRTLKKLDQLSNDELVQIKILQQSVDYCWQGVFELQDNKNNKQKRSGMDDFKEIWKEMHDDQGGNL